jgi:tRNA pseudouridine38-40 synthase
VAETMSSLEPAVRRVRLLVAYDGSALHGFAVNEGVSTVAGLLTEALSTIARRPIEIVGAGRTDAGVHAWGQVVSCDLPVDVDLDGLARRLTKMCAPSVVVRAVESAPSDFHARFSALWRRYRYTILNEPVPDPFLASAAWHVPVPLKVDLMRMAADPLIGEHDFSAFCRRPKSEPGQPEPSMVRRVLGIEWLELESERGGRILQCRIEATAFCHQMVRSIVGTLVDVGQSKITPGEMSGILRSRRREAAGQVAPPHGLCFWAVGYPADGVGAPFSGAGSSPIR